MTRIPSLLAACHVSASGWAVLAAMAFLAVFGQRISDINAHTIGGNQ